MPESPRYQIQVQGRADQAASRMSAFTGGQVNGNGNGVGVPRDEMGLRSFLTTRRW